MKPSQFMDKQIMDLAGSSSATGGTGAGELLDLMNPREDQYRHGGSSNNGSGVMKEDILPSYDFRPIRTGGYGNHGSGTNLDGASRSWGSGDSKLGSDNIRYSNTLETHEQPKPNHEMEKNAYDVATVNEIDQTVKKYADNLLHTLEGVSSRLVQMESRTRHLETSVDELKVTVGNNSGSTDGKLRQLENILREVQTGIQVLRDKQDITDAQDQLSKLQHSSKQDQPPPPPESSTPATSQETPSLPYFQPPPQQSFQPPPPPQQSFQPPPPPQQSFQPTQQSFQPPPPSQQSFQPSQQSFQQPPPPQQPFQPPLPPQQPFQQPTPPHQSAPSQQTQSSLSSAPPQSLLANRPPARTPQPYQLPQFPPQPPPHQEEPSHYAPPPPHQTYPQNIRQPDHYYGPQSDSSYPYNSGSPSHYNSSTMKQQMPFANSPPLSRSSSSAGNYSRLPTAKILPQAAGSVGGGGSSGNKVPVDDVVDKVATMGFSREQVRAAVRKLTENGQSVDLNVVLDKLMNEGGGDMIQPQKGWFGR